LLISNSTNSGETNLDYPKNDIRDFLGPLPVKALLIPFQINPHYLDINPEKHAGETREQRIEEFIALNHGVFVAGLREGTFLMYENGKITLRGNRKIRIFKYGTYPIDLGQTNDLSFLLK